MKQLTLCALFLGVCCCISVGQETGDGMDAAAREAKAAAMAERQDARDQAISELEETVVTPGRVAEDPFEVPAVVIRLGGQEQDRRFVPPTFPDSLRRLPSISTQKTGPGLGSPFIRGFTGFRNVLTIDGVRINNSVFREGPNQYWATLDSLGLGSIEVAPGPAGVIWGSDAAGGVVAAYSAPLDLAEEGATSFGGRLYYRYNTAENSHVARGEAAVGHNGVFGARVAMTFKSFGETNAGGDFGRQEGLSYDAYFIDTKIHWQIYDNINLELLVQSVHLNNVPRIHSTRDGVNYAGTTNGSDRRREFDQDRDLVLLTTTIEDGSFFEEAKFRIGYQSQDEVQDRIRSSGRRDRSGFDLETFFFTGTFKSDTAIGELVYGADLYVDWVDSFSTRFTPGTGVLQEFAQGPIGDGSTYLTLGLFIEDTIALNDWSDLKLGVRYTHVSAESDTVFDPIAMTIGDLDESYDAVVGSAKWIAAVNQQLRVYTNASMGFRAPNLSDLTRFSSARSNEIEIPTTDLDPEFFLGLEAGTKFRTGNVRGHAAIFYTFLWDNIVRTPTGAMIGNEFVVAKSNVGDGHVMGAEAAATWDINSEFSLYGHVSWLDGQLETFPTSMPFEEEEAITRLTPLQGLVALDYEPENTGFQARAEVELVAKQDRLSTRDRADTQRIPPGGNPGYVLFNLRFNYAFDDDTKAVFLHFENLSDENYRILGSGSQEAGFSIIGGFDMRF